MAFELVYSHGGHGGPYHTIIDALDAAFARALGINRSNWIQIYKRDEGGWPSGMPLFRVTVYRMSDVLEVSIWNKNVHEYQKIEEHAIDSPALARYNTRELEDADTVDHRSGAM